MPPTEPPPGPVSPDPGRRRRPYRAPRLIEYGSIPARTLAMGVGSVFDVMSMTLRKT